MKKGKVLTIFITLVILSFSIFMHEFGHYVVAKNMNIMVKELSIGFGPIIYNFHKNETEYSLRLILYGGYNKFYNSKDVETQHLDETKIYENTSWTNKLIILIGGISINLIIGLITLFIFTKLRGKPIINNKSKNNNDELKTLNEKHEYVKKTMSEVTYQKLNTIDSIKFTFKKCFEFAKIMYNLIKKLFKNPRKNSQECEGPITVAKVTNTLFQIDKVYILLITSIINFGLALFNILPIPPLDGGKCLLVALEHVIGKNEMVSTAVTFIGCFLISFFLVSGLKNDIQNYFDNRK